MYLQGQAARRSTAVSEGGFALAAMLVAIAVLSVMLLVALPTWRHLAQREKEMELVFRGEQYARAIGLYQRKLAGAFPPSIDILVEQKFLRKKYKDPITGEDFVPVYANSAAGISALQQGGPQQPTPANSQSARVPATGGQVRLEATRTPGRGEIRPEARATFGSPGAGSAAATGNGIVGVVSKSTAQSIRLYNGRDRYNQWVFTYMSVSPQPAAAPGQPGQPGRRGGGPGPATQGTPGFPQSGRGGQ